MYNLNFDVMLWPSLIGGIQVLPVGTHISMFFFYIDCLSSYICPFGCIYVNTAANNRSDEEKTVAVQQEWILENVRCHPFFLWKSSALLGEKRSQMSQPLHKQIPTHMTLTAICVVFSQMSEPGPSTASERGCSLDI